MSAFKGTPGPWEPAQHGPSGLIYGIRGWHGPESVNVVNWGGISRPASNVGQANARLIAAAPCMLEALRKADEQLGDVECESAADARAVERCHDIIRAAIAKATGGDA